MWINWIQRKELLWIYTTQLHSECDHEAWHMVTCEGLSAASAVPAFVFPCFPSKEIWRTEHTFVCTHCVLSLLQEIILRKEGKGNSRQHFFLQWVFIWCCFLLLLFLLFCFFFLLSFSGAFVLVLIILNTSAQTVRDPTPFKSEHRWPSW